MTGQPRMHRLSVPGAQLYYEVRGSGPLLLAVGQPMTSGAFGPLADLLAEDRTVVTYDPHGLGQSTVDDPSLAVTPEVQADDLAALIAAAGGGPAEVFGTSGGAVAGLALATRRPDLVATLIAHEPPLIELLPDAHQIGAAVDDVENAYRSSGSGGAWGAFVSLVMHTGPVTDAGVAPATWPPKGHAAEQADGAAAGEPPPPTEKQRADDELFFLRMLGPFTRYRPDFAALRAGTARVVVAVGAASGQQIAGRSTAALADQLQSPPVTLPGDHAGFVADPVAFASRLREVLG